MLNAQNKAERKSIKIAGKSKDNYIISEGLAIGDRVLLSGLDKITEGSTIVPIKQ